MRCINNTDKNVTVRKQKIRKNHVREKLIFFTILALILLLAALSPGNSVHMIRMYRIF